MIVGVFVKDIFTGTAEQFDDTFGGGIVWPGDRDDTTEETRKELIMMVHRWLLPHNDVPLDDIYVAFHAKSTDFLAWCDGLEWYETNQAAEVPKPVDPDEQADLDLIRSRIADLEWFQPDPKMDPTYWIAHGCEEYELVPDEDGVIRPFEDDAMEFTDMDAAKAGMNDFHKDVVMQRFFKK